MGYSTIARILKGAHHLVVLTGAGISTASGIPDFRTSENGLWSKYEPMEYASLSVFRTNPEKFFSWLRPLITEIITARPNPAHEALAQMEAHGIATTILTQNIDGLHQLAGSSRVLEIHGSIHTLTCTSCFKHYDAEEFIANLLHAFQLPRCPACGHLLKPDAILFEEQLPIHTWQAAQKAVADCDVLMVLGSSLEVLPVAGLPMRALQKGAALLIINQTTTYIDSRATAVLNEDLTTALPRIADELC